MNVLVGSVTNGNSISLAGSLVPQVLLTGSLSSDLVLQGSMLVPDVFGDYYLGEYEVTPRVGSQVVLNTENKIMKQSVIVGAVPISTIPNASGGETIVIG